MLLAAALASGPAAAVPEASLLGGYAFRSAPDGRAHGAAASISVDVPLTSAFALRPEAFALGFNGSATTPASLALLGAALSLAYRFDDTDARAVVAVGPLGGVSLEGETVAIRAGALASLGLRFPLLEALDLEARVALPLVLWGPRGFSTPGTTTFDDGSANDFPLQTTFSIGVSVDAGALFSEP